MNNNSTAHNPSYTPKTGVTPLTFEIPHSDFNVGDVITKFQVLMQGTHNFYDFNEGITILTDHKELPIYKVNNNNEVVTENNKPVMMNELKENKFAVKFDDLDTHSIQAVFKGNDEIGAIFSNKEFITTRQREGGQGTFRLTSDVPTTMKYMETPKWTWTLTRGGTPVVGETIETVNPTSVYSGQTNSNGQVTPTIPLNILAKWTTGEYTIIGEFYHYDTPQNGKLVTRCYNKIKIEKNTPTMTFTPATTKGGKIKFNLKDPQGRNMVGRKVIIYINNKPYSRKTNENGNANIHINKKGHFKYKCVFAGDDNYNRVQMTREETIS